MIDEKKMIEELAQILNEYGDMYLAGRIVGIIDRQPKTNCSECTRRKFYQQGYQDGLNADKWIPCKERLPELDEGTESFKQSKPCLVAIEWWNGEISESVGWYNQNGFWSDESKNSKVIAWQPFQPYKKEGAENE